MFQMPGSHIIPFKGTQPRIGKDVLLASGACVIGDTVIGRDSSIWFNTIIRGDVHFIRIGERTNIQDNTMVHVTAGQASCTIGNDVTIGHNAVIHACEIEDLCLIGMGAVILDKAVIGKGSLVGAGSLVTQGKVFPPNSLIMGSPARLIRTLNDCEMKRLKESAEHYVRTARAYME
jgi:gamma-carbonic anhydrase